jgi:CDP-glucose 4,6-dehydratase
LQWNELKEVYQGKTVLITGHTGFKGTWLSLILIELGAHVVGYSLEVKKKSLFRLLQLEKRLKHFIGDIRNKDELNLVVRKTKPQMVFHLAAQSLVSRGYEDPLYTIETNVMGTVNVLEVFRIHSVQSLLVVTSDKCYRATMEYCTEESPLGGDDPYSASKAAIEIVVNSYRKMSPNLFVATARAGNSIGAGDRANGRLFPDLLRASSSNLPIELRQPKAQRPWQYVLEPLWGYLILSSYLLQGKHQGAWNFGPSQSVQVEVFVEECRKLLPGQITVRHSKGVVSENHTLRIKSSKAKQFLGWSCKLSWQECLRWTVNDEQQLKQQEPYDYLCNRIKKYAKLWEKK